MNNENRLRIRWLLACMIATLVGYGNPATAADPDFTFVFPAGTACNFDLQIEGWGGNRHFREFKDENGNVVRNLDTGTGFALRFTNISTSKTLSTKSTGSVSNIRYNVDGSSTQTQTGHNVLILYPTDHPAGPSTTLIAGSLVFTVDLDQVFTVLEESGKKTDICAALS
jgi:hypothetical protein